MIAFFFIMTVFSFSRSAYFAFFIFVLVYLSKEADHIAQISFCIVCRLSVLLSFSSSLPQRESEIPRLIPRENRVQRFNLFPRDILSDRMFFQTGGDSIRKHPLFGVGGGNFVKISLTNNRTTRYTDSPITLILEVAAEQGIPAAGILLAIGALFLFTRSRKKDMGDMRSSISLSISRRIILTHLSLSPIRHDSAGISYDYRS
jgi:hypothetical protein